MEKYILAFDLGEGSLGMAISHSGMFITPLKNLRFKAGEYKDAIKLMQEELEGEKIQTIVIGWPTYPSGDPCEMTPIVESFIHKIEPLYPGIPIKKVDERNSTVEAAELLHQNGEKSKKQKHHIDSTAAVVILNRYLRSIGQAD